MKLKELMQHKRESYICILTLLIWIIISVINDNFASREYILDLIEYNGVYFVCALGVLPLMIMRGIDLSVGGMMMAVSVLISFILSYIQLPVVWVMCIALVAGMLLGVINGMLIAKLNVSSVIVTLAMLSLYRGASRYWFRMNPGGNVSLSVVESGSSFGNHAQSIIIALAVLVTYYILKYTRIGRHIYAIGGNPSIALRKGFTKDKVILFVYGYSGLCAGLAAFLHMVLLGRTHAQAYAGIEFELIVIIIIGGLNIMGGYGTVFGTVFAAGFIVMLRSGLVFARIPAFWHDMMIGTIVIGSVSYDMVKKKIVEQKLTGQGEVNYD